MIVKARLMSRFVGGVEALIPPIGTLFVVDLETKTAAMWIDPYTGESKPLILIYDTDGQSIPFENLRLEV